MMKQTVKRALALTLALTMSATLLLSTAWADSGVEGITIGKVTFSVETKTIDGKYIVEPMEEELYSDDTVYTILSRVAKEKNLNVEGAETGYVTKIENFGSYTDSDYGTESGWMAAINNDHTTWPFPALKDGDTVRFCYTYKTYGYDIDLIDSLDQLRTLTQAAEEKISENKGNPFNEKEGYLEDSDSKFNQLSVVYAESYSKLEEIGAFGTNQAYIESLTSSSATKPLYGPGSETENIDKLCVQLSYAIAGNQYVPATSAEITVSGNPAEYYVGRTYLFSAAISPSNATITNGTWKVNEITGTATISESGVLTPTKEGMIVVQYWHPDADNGVLVTKFITVKPSPAQVQMPVLLDSIAASYENTYDNTKIVIDMAAYAAYKPDTKHKTTAEAKQNYINFVLTEVTKASAGEQIFALGAIGLQAIGVDPRTVYPVNSNTAVDLIAKLNGVTHSADAWTAPYSIAAYNQGNYGTDDIEKDLIAQVLKTQDKENGSWSAYGDRIQATANVITGLSFYYNTDEAVKSAVDKAVAYLSAQQKADGTFDAYGSGSDADTCANVVMALAAVGINPDTDKRFTKNEKSALDGLLSFALKDEKGFCFGYTNNTVRSDYATEEGFRALIAASQVMNTGKAYNIYDFSANQVEPGRATGSGAVQKPAEPSGTKDITVTFALKSDVNYWVSPKSVTVKEGSTVYHVFTAALQDTGITYEGAESGYVSSITKDGRTLAEFTNGENSGWLYKVNDALPEVGLTGYEVHNGDRIVWYYTNDWTKDPQAGHYSKPDTTTATTTTTTKANSDGTVKVAVTQNGKELSKVDGGVKVALDTKSGTGSMAVLVDKNGKETPLPKSVVENGKLYVLVPGSCTVKIVDNSRSFTDVKDTDWYASAVDFVAGHGLYDGTGADAFSPKASMSRAMLATVLYRLEGTPISAGDALTQFADGSAVTDWAKDGMSWAVTQKILAGTDGGALAGNENITREQLAVMLARYAKACGLDTKSSGAASLTGQSVSVWAVDAMAWAVEMGLLKGDETGALHPQDAASRAEVAIILQRFVAVLVK